MIRVALLIESLDTQGGGAQMAFLSILDAVRTRPETIVPTCYSVPPPARDVVWERIRRDPERFVLADSLGRIGPGSLGRRVGADLEAGKIDVLHVQGLWNADLVHAARTATRVGVPVLWQSHGMLFRWAMRRKWLKKQVFLRLGLGRALRETSGFICPTRDELENSVLPPSCPPERRFLIRLPVMLPGAMPERAPLRAAGRARFNLPNDGFVFAFLGRLHPIKRVEWTIEAFARAAPQRGSRLLILGSGAASYQRMLRGRAAALGVADRVVFGGWIADDAKREALAAADALVINSVFESFGYVLFEALGVGTPIIVTENISLAAEFIGAGAGVRAGESIEGVAAAMTRMADLSRAERASMARRGFDWAGQEFDVEAIGRRFEETYELVRADRRNGAP